MATRPTLVPLRPDFAVAASHRVVDSSFLAADLVRMQALGADGNAAVDLGDYLRDISRAIISALSAAGEVNLRVRCEGRCLVQPRHALPLGLIVVELVTNAVKYAHPSGVPGEIVIACRRRSDGTIVVEVSDDGVGLPEGLDPMNDGHLGLRLVRLSAAQLGGHIRFISSELGLSCVLQMPLEGAA